MHILGNSSKRTCKLECYERCERQVRCLGVDLPSPVLTCAILTFPGLQFFAEIKSIGPHAFGANLRRVRIYSMAFDEGSNNDF